MRYYQHMTSYHVPNKKWRTQLRPVLKEDALHAVFLEMPAANMDNYNSVKIAIMTSAGILHTSKFATHPQVQTDGSTDVQRFQGCLKLCY